MRTLALLLLRILVSAVLVGWLLYSVDWGLLFRSLSGIGLYTIVTVYLISAIALGLATLRWHQLIPNVPLKRLGIFTLMGVFYAAAIPGQIGGELWKIVRFTSGQDDSARLAASVLFDKLMGLTGQVVASATALWLSLAFWDTDIPMAVSVMVFGSVGAVVITILCLQLPPHIMQRIFALRTIQHQRIQQTTNYLYNLLVSWKYFASQPLTLVSTLLLGAATHLCHAFMFALLAQAVGISIPFVDWIWISSVVSIMLLLPITVAGLGLREGVLVALLGWFGVAPATAFALSLIVFALYILSAIPGLVLDLSWNTSRGNKTI